MSIPETESTSFTLLPLDRFTKLSNDQASIKNQPMLVNVEKEIADTDDEFYHLIKSSALANNGVDNLINIETQTSNVQVVNNDGMEIFQELSLSERSDLQDLIELALNHLSISMTKPESVDNKIKDEIFNTDDKFYYLMESSALANYSVDNLINFETEKPSIQDVNYDGIKISNEVSLLESYRSDIKDSVELNLIQSSTPVTKHELADIKIETHDTDSTPIILDLETSLKDDNCEKLKRFKDAYQDKNFVESPDIRCDFCDEVVSLESLTRHCKVHVKNKTFNCKICNETLKRKENLIRHLKKIHFVSEKNWKCNICDESFFLRSCLILHNLIHSRDLSTVCKICDKKFSTIYVKKQHEISHSNKKNQTCKTNDKSFKKKVFDENMKELIR